MELGGKIVVIRDFSRNDYNFIISRWLNNYYHGSADFTKNVSRDNYYKFHHILIERILARTNNTKVAVFEDQPDIILGFIVSEEGPGCVVLHYLYCKPAYRKNKVASILLSSMDTTGKSFYCTHLTKIGSRLKIKVRGLEYVPYLVS